MIIAVVGVRGNDKRKLGRALARRLAARFYDACDSTPASGNTEDWLDLTSNVLRDPGPRKHLVVACPALRRAQRDRLRGACEGLRFVFINPASLMVDGSQRQPPHQPSSYRSVLARRLAVLEPPTGSEDALLVDDDGPPVETVADRVVARFMVQTNPDEPASSRTDS